MKTYGWKDRTYGSIPKDHVMTRAHWLIMDALERDRQLTFRQAEERAWAQIVAEDNPQLELVA